MSSGRTRRLDPNVEGDAGTVVAKRDGETAPVDELRGTVRDRGSEPN